MHIEQSFKPRRSMKLLSLTLFVLCLLLALAATAESSKKGVGLSRCSTSQEAISRVERLRPAWYYNWSPKPSFTGPTSVEFVPMIWGVGKDFAANLDSVKAYDHLLVFNEPDNKRQLSMSPEELIAFWPLLRSASKRLSSPAAARALGPWMKEFHHELQSAGLDYDFFAVHWYGKPDATRFLKFLKRVHETYKKPIWITEFAVADWEAVRKGRENRYSVDLTIAFMKEVLPALESLDYVERYAWFGIPCKPKDALKYSMFFEESGELTKLGRFYANFLDDK